ncbi:poly-gamma-glutamate hydrolase family protein [Streptosporangium sp. NPDC000396]|uniref:poly-gamma-glutamate hydrolase family protein n=1 Tax=Streptosporangium sp. NPDC000396 TaxID=3366185 RepID=UPI0036AE9DE9
MKKAMLVLGVVAGLFAGVAPAQAADKYDNYAELAAHEVQGKDYRLVQRFPRGAQVAHIAIHGGAIEAPTTQLADHAARTGNHAFYSFEGIKVSGNSGLHLTSTHFDEPKGVNLVARVRYTVSWHGASGDEATTYVGGRDATLIKRVTAKLRAAGFTVADSTPGEIDGDSPRNIANKNRRGEGVQLEISTGQRRQFFKKGSLARSWIENPANRTAAFYRYTAAVNRALTSIAVPFRSTR